MSRPFGFKVSEETKAKISIGNSRDKNGNWKGDNIAPAQGRRRARKWYPLKPCEVCGSEISERHHKDGNPINNAPENIAFLCRKHHLACDDRLERLHVSSSRRIVSLEERARISEMNRNRIYTDETRAKMSRIRKAMILPRGSNGQFVHISPITEIIL